MGERTPAPCGSPVVGHRQAVSGLEEVGGAESLLLEVWLDAGEARDETVAETDQLSPPRLPSRLKDDEDLLARVPISGNIVLA